MSVDFVLDLIGGVSQVNGRVGVGRRHLGLRALKGWQELAVDERGFGVFELGGGVSSESEVGVLNEGRVHGQLFTFRDTKGIDLRTWSIAHGIKQGAELSCPKICGKELENEGADWTATKWSLPMLSLSR